MSELHRFYKTVEVAPLGAGFGVFLDGRKLKTPAKNDLVLPNAAAAEIIAAEWRAQGDIIDTNSMPITRLVNVAIDRTPLTRAAIVEEIRKYASSDLLCYRTSSPAALYQNQCELWDIEIEWFKSRFDIVFIIKNDSFELFQTETTLNSIAKIAENLEDLSLTIFVFLTTLTGSVILALAMLECHLDAKSVFKKIRIEEDYNASIWGYDDEDLAKANGKLAEILACEKLIRSIAQ